MLSIDQNLLYFIITTIIVLILLATLIAWKRVMKTDSKVEIPSKPSENNETGDLESKCIKDEIVSPIQNMMNQRI